MCTQPVLLRRDASVPRPRRRVCPLRDRAHTAAQAIAHPAARACVRAMAQWLTSGLTSARHMVTAGHGLRRTCAAAQDTPHNARRPPARSQGSRPLHGHAEAHACIFDSCATIRLRNSEFARNLFALLFTSRRKRVEGSGSRGIACSSRRPQNLTDSAAASVTAHGRHQADLRHAGAG